MADNAADADAQGANLLGSGMEGSLLSQAERTARQLAIAERVAAAGSPELARDALVAELRALVRALDARQEWLDLIDALTLDPALDDRRLELAQSLSPEDLAGAPMDIRLGRAWAELWGLQPMLDALRGIADMAGVATAVGTAHSPTVTTTTLSARTLALATMPDTVAMERTLARLPLYAQARQAVAQLTLWATGSLYGHPVRIVQGSGPMDDRAYRLLAHLIRAYAGADCPPERRVPFTLSEAARWAGYGKGGRQLRLVRDSLLRMRATALESAIRYPDGHTESLAWGLIDRGWTTDAVGRSGGFVTLSEELAGLIRQGSLVYLDAPTLDALGERDGMAVILWGFLEGESKAEWRHSLFSAPEGYPPVDNRETLAIADLLRVSGWDRRRRAKDRVAKACTAIMAVDTRYRLAIERGKGRGMWTLAVSRDAGTPRGARRVLSGALVGTPGGASGYSWGRGPVQNGGLPSVSTVGSTEDSLPGREKRARARPRGARQAVSEAEDRGRPDIAAYLERTGFPRLVPKLAKLLDDLADRHDLTGYTWAADRIREAPIRSARPGDDIYRFLLEADQAWRDGELEAADRTELRAETDKAEERRQAAQRLADIVHTPKVAAAIVGPVPSLRPMPAPVDPETLARRRLAAIELLRSGEPTVAVANRLRDDYGITDDEISAG